MDRDHEHDPEVPIAWALAIDDAPASLNGCGRCAREAVWLRAAVNLLSEVEAMQPPAQLRARVLARARAGGRRRAVAVTVQALAYAGQVEAFDALLDRLAPADWRAEVSGDRDVRALVAHLTGNDALVAADIGVSASTGPPGHVRQEWRERATALLEEVAPWPAERLDRPVRMAGRRPSTRSLRDGLVQRAFETWIHADDIRAATGLPLLPPQPEHVRLIADLGARLLPGVLRGREGFARLFLGGPGGGVWELRLGTIPGHDPVTVITMDALEFCRLLAGRRTPGGVRHSVEGDAGLARAILHAAATLGCE